MKDKRIFMQGMKDGMPVALGYLSVSFAFGMLAVENGLPPWAAVVTSLTSLTGTGQFVGVDMLAKGAALAQIACTVLVINLRYLLMALSWSQRLDPKLGPFQRMLLAFGNTDEVFAVSMAQPGMLKASYLAGLILTPLLGWVGGTLLGCVASGVLPASVRAALGIAIYAMFLAIIVPPARDSKPVMQIILIAAGLSLLMRYAPGLRLLGSGWSVILCGIAAAAFGAWRYPAVEEVEHDDQ